MKVIYHDPFPPPADVASALGAEPRETLDDVLREADFVSLHCPALPGDAAPDEPGSTCPHAAATRSSSTPPAATWWTRPPWSKRSRRSGSPGAGLDVYEREPQVTQALTTMDNVVLLPHLGSATAETRVAMGMRAVENLQLFFSGKPLRDRVV